MTEIGLRTITTTTTTKNKQPHKQKHEKQDEDELSLSLLRQRSHGDLRNGYNKGRVLLSLFGVGGGGRGGLLVAVAAAVVSAPSSSAAGASASATSVTGKTKNLKLLRQIQPQQHYHIHHGAGLGQGLPFKGTSPKKKPQSDYENDNDEGGKKVSSRSHLRRRVGDGYLAQKRKREVKAAGPANDDDAPLSLLSAGDGNNNDIETNRKMFQQWQLQQRKNHLQQQTRLQQEQQPEMQQLRQQQEQQRLQQNEKQQQEFLSPLLGPYNNDQTTNVVEYDMGSVVALLFAIGGFIVIILLLFTPPVSSDHDSMMDGGGTSSKVSSKSKRRKGGGGGRRGHEKQQQHNRDRTRRWSLKKKEDDYIYESDYSDYDEYDGYYESHGGRHHNLGRRSGGVGGGVNTTDAVEDVDREKEYAGVPPPRSGRQAAPGAMVVEPVVGVVGGGSDPHMPLSPGHASSLLYYRQPLSANVSGAGGGMTSGRQQVVVRREGVHSSSWQPAPLSATKISTATAATTTTTGSSSSVSMAGAATASTTCDAIVRCSPKASPTVAGVGSSSSSPRMRQQTTTKLLRPTTNPSIDEMDGLQGFLAHDDDGPGQSMLMRTPSRMAGEGGGGHGNDEDDDVGDDDANMDGDDDDAAMRLSDIDHHHADGDDDDDDDISVDSLESGYGPGHRSGSEDEWWGVGSTSSDAAAAAAPADAATSATATTSTVPRVISSSSPSPFSSFDSSSPRVDTTTTTTTTTTPASPKLMVPHIAAPQCAAAASPYGKKELSTSYRPAVGGGVGSNVSSFSMSPKPTLTLASTSSYEADTPRIQNNQRVIHPVGIGTTTSAATAAGGGVHQHHHKRTKGTTTMSGTGGDNIYPSDSESSRSDAESFFASGPPPQPPLGGELTANHMMMVPPLPLGVHHHHHHHHHPQGRHHRQEQQQQIQQHQQSQLQSQRLMTTSGSSPAGAGPEAGGGGGPPVIVQRLSAASSFGDDDDLLAAPALNAPTNAHAAAEVVLPLLPVLDGNSDATTTTPGRQQHKQQEEQRVCEGAADASSSGVGKDEETLRTPSSPVAAAAAAATTTANNIPKHREQLYGGGPHGLERLTPHRAPPLMVAAAGVGVGVGVGVGGINPKVSPTGGGGDEDGRRVFDLSAAAASAASAAMREGHAISLLDDDGVGVGVVDDGAGTAVSSELCTVSKSRSSGEEKVDEGVVGGAIGGGSRSPSPSPSHSQAERQLQQQQQQIPVRLPLPPPPLPLNLSRPSSSTSAASAARGTKIRQDVDDTTKKRPTSPLPPIVDGEGGQEEEQQQHLYGQMIKRKPLLLPQLPMPPPHPLGVGGGGPDGIKSPPNPRRRLNVPGQKEVVAAALPPMARTPPQAQPQPAAAGMYERRMDVPPAQSESPIIPQAKEKVVEKEVSLGAEKEFQRVETVDDDDGGNQGESRKTFLTPPEPERKPQQQRTSPTTSTQRTPNDNPNAIQHKRKDLTNDSSDASMALALSIPFSDLTLLEVIGGGGFGQVWKAAWHGTPVAVKMLTHTSLLKGNRDNKTGSGVPSSVLEEFAAEINLLSGMRHPNICLYLGACLEAPNWSIVTELAAHGSLWDALRKPLAPPFVAVACDGSNLLHCWPPELYSGGGGGFAAMRQQRSLLPNPSPLGGTWPWTLVKRVASGAARGLTYLHGGTPPVLHRDLKSANLLLDESYTTKVADFGLSRIKAQERSMTGNCGTVQWMAPEVLANHRYAEPADVYSFGIILWELLTRECPYEGMSPIQCALAVLNDGLRPEIPSWCPPALAALICSSLAHEPSARPTFKQILSALDAMP